MPPMLLWMTRVMSDCEGGGRETPVPPVMFRLCPLSLYLELPSSAGGGGEVPGPTGGGVVGDGPVAIGRPCGPVCLPRPPCDEVGSGGGGGGGASVGPGFAVVSAGGGLSTTPASGSVTALGGGAAPCFGFLATVRTRTTQTAAMTPSRSEERRVGK